MATDDQISTVRDLLNVRRKELLSDNTIDTYLCMAQQRDKTGDDNAIALLACSILTRSAMWNRISRTADGVQIQSSDEFRKEYFDHIRRLGYQKARISNSCDYGGAADLECDD